MSYHGAQVFRKGLHITFKELFKEFPTAPSMHIMVVDQNSVRKMVSTENQYSQHPPFYTYRFLLQRTFRSTPMLQVGLVHRHILCGEKAAMPAIVYLSIAHLGFIEVLREGFRFRRGRFELCLKVLWSGPFFDFWAFNGVGVTLGPRQAPSTLNPQPRSLSRTLLHPTLTNPDLNPFL